MASEQGFVVSDLHLGAGDAERSLENFDQDVQFSDFVLRIASPGTTLFINGDFIDFPQIPPYEVPLPHYLLWNEATSLLKLKTAIIAHTVAFDALRELVTRGARLCLMIGNHDLDLIWPSVQDHIRTVLGNPSQETLWFTSGSERFHGVHIEHGHAFTPENALEDPAVFIHEWPKGSGDRYLERVWGTDFMLQFYNNLERGHPYADAVKPMVTALYQGIKHGWIGGQELVRLVKFLKRRGINWTGIASAVLAPEKATFADVVSAFNEEEAWHEMVLTRLREDSAFRGEIETALANLPQDEQTIMAHTNTVEVGLADPSGITEADATLGIFREDREVRAARSHLAEDGVTHVVYGHTHLLVDGALDGHLFNPGTWLPRLDLSSPPVKSKIRAHGLTLDMLNEPSLYVADRHVVQIAPDPPRASRVWMVRV